MRTTCLLVVAAAVLAACGPQRNDADGSRDARPRDASPDPDGAGWIECQNGQNRCFSNVHQLCREAGEFTEVVNEDCAARGQVCVENLWCVACNPNTTRCSGDETAVERCRMDGSGWDNMTTCDLERGEACRNARCVVLCQSDSIRDTNIGCEYYSADLDNAVTNDGRSAASQQYAVVVSNPDEHLTARVRIERNIAPVGMPPIPQMVASAVIGPRDLETFRLPAREVDCSPVGTFDTGTGTCLSSQAYRITATIPVIAYQFNPLENVSVFSNDASLLLPTNSISGDYVVTSWPQTISRSNPDAGFNLDLRAFLTIVGTADDTSVTVTPTANIIPTSMTGPLPMGAMIGRPFTVRLGRYDVLNLETGTFLSDFTGTRIQTNNPVSVFAGSEASDSPIWNVFGERLCCADHLEEQIYPRRTAAQDYVLPHMPSRTAAVLAAGGPVAMVLEPQWYRFVAVGDGMTHVRTTLPRDSTDPDSIPIEFDLLSGQQRTLRAFREFEAHADGPLAVATVTGGQATTGIPPGPIPGGDPSFIMIPPIRQWRQNYVFLTPDRYAFDFVTIIARRAAHVTLRNGGGEDTPLPYADCPMERADHCRERPGRPPCPNPEYVVYRCQLSFPTINTNRAPVVMPGRQDDGVHVVTSDDREAGIMVIVSGFDSYVGYGYPAGTRLTTID